MQFRVSGKWALAAAVITLLSACTVVDLDSSGKPVIPADPNAAPSFIQQTPQQVAESLWSARLLPAAEQQALAWPALLAKRDGLTGTDSISVFGRFNGTVASVDNDGRERKMRLTVNGEEVVIQLGPIVKGNALRDAAGFIRFEDFKNQVQFAQAARALNKKALEQLPPIDASWQGKEVAVLAAFTLRAQTLGEAVPLKISEEARP